MRKGISFLLGLVIIFSLVGCAKEDEVQGFEITLSSNIEQAAPSMVKGDIVKDSQSYTISTTEIDGFVFEHWHILDTTVVLTSELSFQYTPTYDVAIEAVYSEVSNVVEPTLFYEADFEDGDKAAYADGVITLASKSWNFVDALVGNLDTDLNVSGNSVRIRDGYIETQFSVANLSQVIFHAGTYGSDDNATVTFQVSIDGTTWVTVDTFTSTATITEYSYLFDDAMFTSLSLSADSNYYLKVISSADGRTNVDDFQIFTGE